jgi:DNA repair protein SbcC/Rad50
MRLLALELQGFGAFRAPTRLTFDDADFFALVGPTGSGKSTILDAVCFALYGSVPRYESENLIRYVVTLGALEARVRLDFELAGDHYIATRVARRNSKGVVSTKEARLERVTAGDSTEVIAGSEREMSAAIIRLLGLRFDDFTRCVALPQGDFARFLRAKGDERRDLLLRLLNLSVYTELGATARRMEAEARSQIALIDGELQRFAAATPEALDAAHGRQARLAVVSAQVEAAQPVLADLTAKEQATLGRANEAAGWAQRLRIIAVPESIRSFAARQREAQAALETATGVLTEASATRKEAVNTRQPLPDLAELRATRRAHDELAQCVGAIESSTAALREQVEAAARAQGAFDAAGVAAREAAEGLEGIRRQHLAHAVAETLVAGEPCPVCEQMVSRLPERVSVTALADAKRFAEEREQALVRARADHAAADKRVAAETARLETLSDQRAKLTVAVQGHPDLAALDAFITRVETADAAVTTAQAAENGALEQVEVAKAAVVRLDSAAQRARNDFAAQRDTVAALAPPAAGNRDVLTDWEALAEWAAALGPAQEEAAANERAGAEAHARKRAERLAELHAALETAGVPLPGGADAMALVGAVASATTAAAHAVGEIEAAMEQAEKLRKTRVGLDEDADVAKLLGQLLRADRFPEWLVAEALGVLTIDASEILRQLTGGQFSLAVGDKEFVVIDHANADERRPARTLSGGETFQASLALALALSQQIRNLAAEGAPRLDAIFLDEGFGTLDPETLDVVAATIENLGQSGRMVGVVTHVSELAARVPVRFVVRKGLGTSTIEKVAP